MDKYNKKAPKSSANAKDSASPERSAHGGRPAPKAGPRFGRPAPGGKSGFGGDAAAGQKPAPGGEPRFGRPAPGGKSGFGGDAAAGQKPAPGGEPRFGRPAPGGKFGFGGDAAAGQKPAPGGEPRFGRPAPGGKSGFGGKTPGVRPRFGRPVPGGAPGRRPAVDAEPASTGLSARDVARQALSDVVRSGSYVSAALDRNLNTSRLSADDKRLAANLFFTAVENRLLLDARLSRFWETRPDPVVEDILHIAAAQLLLLDRVPDHAAVDEAVKQVRASGREGLSGLANGVLRNLIRARDAGELPEITDPAIRYSIAPHLARRLIAAYGAEEAEKIMADRPRPSQTIRFHSLKTNAAAFERYLTDHDVIWERGVVPGAYRCPAAGNLARLDGFRNGYFSIQGESSMLAALATQARPGMNVLDACAAPGGKSALIAEMMGDVGRVYAWDVHDHRVELIRAAKKRLGFDSLRPAVRDARKPCDDFELYMDAVLIDAPCSGLGVIADKPDIKYRLTDEQIAEVTGLQAELLDNCARFVRVGGLMVYSTCTILPEENMERVRAFLARHPEFEPVAEADYLPEALRARVREGMAQFFSHRDGIEGFFIARMRRKGV